MVRRVASVTTANSVLPLRPAAVAHASERQPLAPPRPRLRADLATLVWFLPATLIAIILWIIWTQTAQVPYWDEWKTVSLVVAADHGQLSLGSLWAFHGVHRIFLTRLVDVTLIRLTNWNRQVEMTFDLAVALGGAWLLYSLVRTTVRSARFALGLVVPLSLLYFSLAQFGTWFAPFQLQFTLAVVGLLLALCALTTPARQLSWRRFALGLLGAMIGMLAALPGMIVWFTVLPTLACWVRQRRGRLQIALWVSTTSVAWGIYLTGFPGHGDYTHSTARQLLAYILIYLGAPLGYPDVARSELFGAIGIALWPATVALYLLLGGRLRRLVPWLDVLLFVVLCTGATVIGRVDGGPSSALTSRYQIFSALWWIALIVVSALALERLVGLRSRHLPADQGQARPARVAWATRAQLRIVERQSIIRAGYVLLLALGCLSLLAANIAGARDALLWQNIQRGSQYRLYDLQTLPGSCLSLYYPPKDVAEERGLIASLAQTHYGIFAVPLSQRQRLARSEAASPYQGCAKPYHFIDDVPRQPNDQQAGLALTAAAPHSHSR